MTSTGAKTAASVPLSATETRDISRPRAATASSASSSGRTPAVTRAPYSPRLCPMTMSGAMPYSLRRRPRAMSVVRTAGCVMEVCFSSSSAAAMAAGSFVSKKT